MIDINNKKILLVRNDNIGDLICTTPSIEALRKKYPKNQIDIVVNSYNHSAIDCNLFIDTVYCYTKPKHKKNFFEKIKASFGKLKILLKIKQEKYDVVIVLRSDYSKSAELFSNITNALHKVGVKNPNGKDNFTMHIPVSEYKHEVEFCFDCLEPFGVKQDKEKTWFYIPDELIKKYIEHKKSILFHISSRKKENCYPIEQYKEIINCLKDKNILISAEPDDFKKAELLARQTHATFIKTSSLLDLAGLIDNVKLFITLDGGAMHVGPARGTTTISVSGSTNMDKWHPWGYKDFVLQDKTKIASNIKSKQIVDTINQFLNGFQ